MSAGENRPHAALGNTAVSLVILALGSLGFSALLVVHTVSTDYASPPTATLAISLAASVAFCAGAGLATVLAKRERSRR